MLLNKTIKSFISQRLERWLSKRVPSNNKHKLSSRNIFIMPTRFGFTYLFFDVLLFSLGTNYQNNTILLLSYLLASLFITVMMHSFYNVSQLTFTSTATQYTFAKQQAYFPITITAKKTHFDLNFIFSTQKESASTLKQCNAGENQVLIPYMVSKRGIVNLGRVKVFSEYSLGLFITWSMLDFSHQLVVFPQPKKLNNSQNYLSELDENSEKKHNIANEKTTENGDFSELKNFITGESPARVAWKQLARGQGKYSKHYENQQGSLRWLKLSNMPSVDIESKLSYLSYLIIEYSKTNLEYGLLLNASTPTETKPILTKIMPNSGYQHQQKCLIALAKFTVSET